MVPSLLDPSTTRTAAATEALLDQTTFTLRVVETVAARRGICGVLLVEVERLSQVFRVHGQQVLDRAMAELGRRVASCCRPTDLLCRFGLTQFGILLPDLEHASKALFAASAIVNRLAEPIDVAGRRAFLTAKIGVAVSPDDADDGFTLIRNSATAMEAAIRSGTASYTHYTPSMGAELMERLTLEDELRQAIRDGAFELHYQPKVLLPDGVMVGGEALLRWNHPQRGMVSPAVFIPAAEESGLIVQIGEWALRQAVGQIRTWLDQGLPPIQIAVNVSERQFRWGHLPALIDVLLQESGIPPHLLQIEITETILPDDLEGALQQMRWIADRGVALALDDFGTGYSSLSYLRELPLDCLKVDRHFVRDMEADARTRHIVEAIVAMARAMDLRVVAEGVEAQGQVELLSRLGVEEAQGFLFAKPLPVAAFEARLRDLQAR